MCLKKKKNRKLNDTKDKDIKSKGFPGGSVVKDPAAGEEDMGSIPDPGRSRTPRSN